MLTPRRFLLRTLLIVCGALAILALDAWADDWPQWMGPNRDDVWAEKGIVETFPAGGLKVLWRIPIAGGYSGPAVAAGKVFVMDYVRADGDTKNDFSARTK